MAQFLSPEWMEELNQLAAADDELAGVTAGIRLTVQQVVARPGLPTTTYAIRIGDGRVELLPGGVPSPDVILSEDYATASALSRGELTAQAALLAGRIQVEGDTRALIRGQEALSRAQQCFDSVRARTTY